MALTETNYSGLNASYGLQSAIARRVGFVAGTLAVTYSSAGGLSWTLPFTQTLYVSIPPQSQYIFSYNATTNMFTAYQCVVTTTALASTLVEVASDTDFTELTDSLRFVAFGIV